MWFALAALKQTNRRWFDGRGRSLGVVGRVGGGQAEYRDPYSSAWLGDTLAIYDPRESRILYMTQGETYLRTETTARYTLYNGQRHAILYVVSGTASFGFPVSADGAIAVGNTGQYAIRMYRRNSTAATITRNDRVVMPLTDVAWRFGNTDYPKHVAQYGASSCEASPVRPPHMAPLFAFAGDRLAFVTADHDGVQVVHVARVVR